MSRADRDVETAIRRELAQTFPGEAILGEEHGGELADRLWIIDPIDGTANFLRGLPYWSVVLAYTVEGETVIGVIQDPVHGELFAAGKGLGAARNGVGIRCSDRTEANASCIGLSHSYKSSSESYLALTERMFKQGLDHRRMGSAALSLCHVADGRLEGAYAAHANSWDVVAGLCIAEEAGARVTRYTEGHTLLEPRQTLAVAPGISEAATVAIDITIP